MSETLTKAQWQEKKKYGSRKEQRAAVSVQTARILEKLMDRSRDLNGLSTRFPNNALAISKKFNGSSEGNDKAVLTETRNHWNFGNGEDSIAISVDEDKTKSLFGKEKSEKTARISQSHQDIGSSAWTSRHLEVDPEGKRKPLVTRHDEFNNSEGYHRADYTHKPETEEVVRTAAPALYEIKKGVDEAEAEQARRAA